jgi:CRP-like cAMP-binding protein
METELRVHGEDRRQHAAFDLGQWLPDDARADLEAAMKRRRFDAGQIIYLQEEEGGEMYRVGAGIVRLGLLRESGRELLYSFFFEGDYFGESSLIDGLPRPHTAEAHSDVELDVLPAAALASLRARYRSVDDALLRLMARRMRALSKTLAQMRLDEMSSRVASALIGAASCYGFRTDDASLRQVMMSQSDLAAMVGASRQSVNKVLSRMQKDGLVRAEYASIVIDDIVGLGRVAQAA